MNGKLTETESGYGTEISVENTKVMRISRELFSSKTYDRPKATGECEIF
jgi:hypothetical protein